MLPTASNNCKLRLGRSCTATAVDGSRLQAVPNVDSLAGASGVGTGPPLALLAFLPARGGCGSGSDRTSQYSRFRSLRLAASASDVLQPPLPPGRQPQLQRPDSVSDGTSTGGPGSSGTGPGPSSSIASEALRPRRFSAPVIARLLRSTTSLQALADVVQQQSPYMDIPLVTVALLHMALLFSRQQQQQQRQPTTAVNVRDATTAPVAATTTAATADATSRSRTGDSTSNGSSDGNGDGYSAGAHMASPGGSYQVLHEDDGLPLQMTSLLDDDEDVGNVGGDEDLGAAQPAALLEEAAAATPSASERGTPSLALPADERGPLPPGDPLGGEAGARSRVVPRDQGGDTASSSSNGSSGGAGALAAVVQPGTTAAAAGAAGAGTYAAPDAVPGPASLPSPLPSLSSPSPSPMASVLRTLVPVVLSDLDGVGGSDLSKVVSALAVLRYENTVVVEQLLQALSLKLVECSPQELSNVLVSLAMLGVPPDPFVRSKIYSAVKYSSRRFTPRDLALTIWAYGAMGTDVQEDAVLVLLEASKAKLAAFSPLHLAKAAQGLAALRYRPPPEWVAAYCEALRPALRRTASRELCAVLLALADLQVVLDDTTRSTLLVHTLRSLPSLAPPELAASVWALGRLTSAGLPLPALIDLDTSSRVLDGTLGALRGGAFSGGQLAQLLEGLTRLALQPPLEWMQAYGEALKPQLGAMEPRQLAGVLGSLAAQQYRPEPEMQSVVMEATQANMHQLLADTTATASLITALRRLNIEPPPAWVAALLEASRSALKNRATDLHLANLAGALAAWGVRPDGRWIARLMWRSQVLMQQGRMSPRALVALLQAMSALRLRPNPVWVTLCLHTAASRASRPDFEPQHFATLLPALHALEIQPPQEWLGRMLLAMYRCWDRFSITHWSSMLPALVLLRAEPPREWLQRLEEVSAPRLPDCSALQLLTLMVALTQLRSRSAEVAEAAAGGPATTATTAATGAAGGGATEAAASGPSAAGLGGGEDDSRRPCPATATPAAARSADPAAVSTSAIGDTGGVSDGEDGGGGFLSARRLRNARTSRYRQRRLAMWTAAESLPGGPWLAGWWAASGALLGRVRYTPSELLLTASWLVSLGLRPPAEWLEACIDVSQRYSRVMGSAEQMQLAAAVLPLAGRRANQAATKQARKQRNPQPAAAAAAPAPAAGNTAVVPLQRDAKRSGPRRRRDRGRVRRGGGGTGGDGGGGSRGAPAAGGEL